MINRKKYLVLICVSLCLIAGCSKERANQNSNNNDITMNTIQKLDEKGMVVDQKDLDVQNESDVQIESGKIYEELSIVGQEDPNYCNAPMNMKGENGLGLVCKDPLYDITYFVNYGSDYYIYGIHEEQTELVVQIPAKRLFCRKGKLYFMVDGYQSEEDKGYENGNILEYNPTNGEIKVIIPKMVETMFVYQEGIYYIINEGDTITATNEHDFGVWNRTKWCYLFENQTDSELKDSYTTFNRWNDKFFDYVVEPYHGDNEKLLELAKTNEIMESVATKLVSVNSKQEEVLDVLLELTNYIYEDELYTLKGSNHNSILYRLNLNQMKKTSITLPGTWPNDFVICNGFCYFTDCGVVNLTTGDYSKGYIKNTSEIKCLQELYTDGERLYGLYGNIGAVANLGQLKQIEVIDSPENAIMIDTNSELIEHGRYEFKLSPMTR